MLVLTRAAQGAGTFCAPAATAADALQFTNALCITFVFSFAAAYVRTLGVADGEEELATYAGWLGACLSAGQGLSGCVSPPQHRVEGVRFAPQRMARRGRNSAA